MRTVLHVLVAVAALWSCALPGQTNTGAFSYEGELLGAIVHFGFATGAPIGLEIRDWEEIEREVKVVWTPQMPPRRVLAHLLGRESPLSVVETDGILLVKSRSSSENSLDTVLPEFYGSPTSLRVLEFSLHGWLKQAIDPAPQPGWAGHLPGAANVPFIGPFDLTNVQVRGVLSAIVTAAPDRGLWLADGTVTVADSLDPPLWRIVSYLEDEDDSLARLKGFAIERKRMTDMDTSTGTP